MFIFQIRHSHIVRAQKNKVFYLHRQNTPYKLIYTYELNEYLVPFS